MHNLAVLFQHQGQYKVADDMNERALKEKEKEKEKIGTMLNQRLNECTTQT